MTTRDIIAEKLTEAFAPERLEGIDRHRMVNATLAGELAGGVHALAIRAAAPGEAEL
jgi:stress-induced morphogen